MNRLIKKFGEIVANAANNSPKRALNLLRLGYFLNYIQLKLVPDPRLLPHQDYIAMISNKAIRKPLANPQDSAVVNIFFPCQILHSMDIIPQFTEGLACYLNGAGCEGFFIQYAEKYGIPQTYCSYHKVLLGAVLSDVIPAPKFVATTSLACDANNTTFRTIAAHYQIPYYLVDVPNVCSQEAIDYVANQLKELVSMIEDISSKRMDEDRLRMTIKIANRSMMKYKKHLSLLKDRYMSGSMTAEMFKIFPTHILLGREEADNYFSLLLEDTKTARRARNEKRILWVHTMPFWQESLKEILNYNPKCQLLPCDINFDSLEEMDENKPYESIARRLLLNLVNGPGERRGRAVVDMAKELKADGIVYFCHWGCKHTLGNVKLITDIIKEEGFPLLILDGDGCDRNNINDGQMATKLQAFLELLGVACV